MQFVIHSVKIVLLKMKVICFGLFNGTFLS